MKGSISLIVTHVPPKTKFRHIKKSTDKILTGNEGATDEHNVLINKLKDDGSLHLFCNPSGKSELTVRDLLAPIDASSKYSDVKGKMVNIASSKKTIDCSFHLLNTAGILLNSLQ